MRYSRQVLFEKIGSQGQEKISKASVLILGLGATGSNSAELLTRAGIGSLTLIDRDIIEESNLQRQTLFKESDISLPKAFVAKKNLEEINSNIKIKAYFKDINDKNISEIIKKPDLILDCCDNMQTRFLLDEYCYKNNIPWIYLGIIESTGMLFKIVPKKTPSFKDIFKELSQPIDSCDISGVLNTTASFGSSLQVTEALKHLTSQAPNKELIFFDVWKSKIQNIKINHKPGIFESFPYLNGEKSNENIKLCGTGSYQLNGPKLNLKEVSDKLKKLGEVKLNEFCLIFKELTIFEDGRVLIKADDEKRAKSLYAKYIGY